MRNSDPRVSIVSVQRHNSDINSMFTVQITGCNFQYGPNFGVSLDPAFRLWCCFFSWKSVFTTSHCIKFCEISSVFRHEILSILNNTQKSLHPYRIYSICLVVTASQFVLHICCNRIFLIRWVIIIQRNFCLDRTEHEWGTWLSHHNKSPRSLVKGFILFTYLSDCSVKTELVCRDNYAKNSFNRFLVGCIVYRQFTMSFAFELISGQWRRSTENRTSALSEFQQHLFCKFVPNSLWTVFFDRVPLFSEPGPINDHCPLPNLLAYKDTSRTFARHSVSLSFVPQEMSLNIDMNRMFLVKFSGVSSNLNSKLLTSSLSCNVLNPGKIFHSNSIGSPSILSKFL